LGRVDLGGRREVDHDGPLGAPISVLHTDDANGHLVVDGAVGAAESARPVVV
jgi:hypothetical protein